MLQQYSDNDNGGNGGDGDAATIPRFGRLLLPEITMGRPCRCLPLIKPPTLFFNPASLRFPSEVFEFFLFTPEGRARFPPRTSRPFPTVHPFIGTPECLHFETGRVADRHGPYVGFMNFICSDKTTRIYSRRACRQFGWIFINEKGDISFSFFCERNRTLRRADRKVGIRGREREIIGREFHDAFDKWMHLVEYAMQL